MTLGLNCLLVHKLPGIIANEKHPNARFYTTMSGNRDNEGEKRQKPLVNDRFYDSRCQRLMIEMETSDSTRVIKWKKQNVCLYVIYGKWCMCFSIFYFDQQFSVSRSIIHFLSCVRHTWHRLSSLPTLPMSSHVNWSSYWQIVCSPFPRILCDMSIQGGIKNNGCMIRKQCQLYTIDISFIFTIRR